MGKLCNLGFSDETQGKLRSSYAENPSALLIDHCQCGKREVAKNHGGEWIPATHERPVKGGAYKGGGYKRGSK
jgi:hypothetical protein